MIQEKEQNKEMTAQESLNLIGEMLNNSRRSILRNSAKYYILWGALLVVWATAIYALWSGTGNPAWNWLWFAMPAVGYPLAAYLSKRDVALPENMISKHVGGIWIAYGIYTIALVLVGMATMAMPIPFLIVVVLGFAECISGVLLKNWPIMVAGFVLGVGGALAIALLDSPMHMLVFTFGGVVLVLTGLIVKYQYK